METSLTMHRMTHEHRVVKVLDLVNLLRDVGPAEFNPDTVNRLLAGVSVDDASLQRYVLWQPQQYTRNLIYRDDVFELLAVCWESGCSSPIHDHAGQDCWLYVHSGLLGMDAFELVDTAQCRQIGESIGIRRMSRCDLVRGQLDHRGPEQDIHRVYNRRAWGQRAMSLHVYARPFDECVVYEPAHQRAHRRILRYHSIDGLPV